MRFRLLPALLVIAITLLFVVPSAVGFTTDWLWFKELGYEGVFLRSFNTQAIVFGIAFAIVFLFIYFNLRIARQRTIGRAAVVLGTGVDGRPITIEGQRVAGLAMPVAIGAAMLVGFSAASNWLAWLNFIHSTPFGTVDPLFNRDVAFYVFKLPVYQSLQSQTLAISMLTLIGCGMYYVLSGSFVIEARPGGTNWPRIRLMPAARRHLTLLAALVFALMAWGAWLELPGILLTPTTRAVSFGASYADVHARVPLLWVTIAVLMLGAVLSVAQGFGRRGWLLPLAVGLYVLVMLTGGLYASIIQRVIVTPNEQDREQPFILHNIAATRTAFALDNVEEREVSGDATLSEKDIINNAETLENVRLWDQQPLLQTFTQIQEFRPYYDFIGIDNDRYRIKGRYQQVMLSVREMTTESLQNRSWVNDRLQFTHGYGLTLGPVNQVTTAGLPVLYIQNLPPISTVDLKVEQPSIYFGELSSSYAIVKTRQPEFHYPKGDDNETTYYEGTGGVPLYSWLRRMMFAIRFGSTDILVTAQLTKESRILYHRQIVDRVRTLAPFLTYDSDPYPVVHEGRVFWIQDAYTTTTNYPYSTPRPFGAAQAEVNYVRNSVKVVIDAYNGGVSFYLAEPNDPLAETIGKVFPGIFRPIDEMPAGLRSHVRYPEDIFKVQTSVYATYHMTNPHVFYNKEDQWQVPAFDGEGGSAAQMQPYYTIMKLPGETRSEFIQMLPLTPRVKDNMAAWMVARSDGSHYGRLFVFQFPKQQIVFGPRQVIGLINQDQTISPQITLWNQQGSRVIWGTLLVIPVDKSLLYIRPLYLRSSNSPISALKQVVVVYNSKIVMADTLRQAIGRLFGARAEQALAPDLLTGVTTVVETTEGAPMRVEEGEPDTAGAIPQTGKPATATETALIAEMRDHFTKAEAAMKAGDLGLYAAEIKRMEAALTKLEKIKR